MSKRILAGLEPAAVWRYFEDISGIPRVSGNEAAVSDYVAETARAMGLSVYRDEARNVFVRLPADGGRDGSPATLLQGHLDMVGEKDPSSPHDFTSDGLSLRLRDGWIDAQGTTLGADDGVAVALMLALLADPPSPRPPIECLFTVSEETGLCGARTFDPAAAGSRARFMINLDSGREGVLTAGCAGGVRTDLTLPAEAGPVSGAAVRLSLSGFSGGHSGVEIAAGHANAIKVLGRLLSAVRSGGLAFRIAAAQGGGKDNAIPCEAEATLVADPSSARAIAEAAAREAELIRQDPELIPADADFVFRAEVLPDRPSSAMSEGATARLIALLTLARDGALSMSARMEGLPACSRNLGILSTAYEGGIPVAATCSFLARSARDHHLDEAEREAETLGALTGATARHRDRYPGWDFVPESRLRDIWTEQSGRLFGVIPRVEAIHAGLECGILRGKMPDLDIISVGPDMRDIHTARERLSVASTERTYRLIRAVLQGLA